MTDVRFENVTFGYGDESVFEGVNIDFSGSGLTCILGPNGVGKTTLVKCINKLLKPRSGKVLIDGTDVQTMSLPELARIMAFVPNSSTSVFSMSVAEAILIGRHPRAGWTTSEKDIEVVDDTIRLLGLEEYSDRDIRELSAGQLQRVLIARGLVQEPEVLILDEPTSNLDVRYQMDVMRFLKDYAREKGILVLMVCHDLNITAAYADRVVLMHNGGIFADGKASDVLTEENIETVYRVKAKVMEIEGTYHIALLPE